MSTGYTTPENRRHTADVFRANWLWLVLLGAVLVAAGVVAILVPAVSTIAASKVLGSVLIVSGIVQVMQSAKMLSWIGFIWHLLLGILAAIGGALIYMDPFAGVIALTVLIAIIFAVHGATQVAFAWKVRRQPGWYWFLVSGGHRPDRERASGGEAALQPVVHAGDRRRHFSAVRGLGLRRHGTRGAQSWPAACFLGWHDPAADRRPHPYVPAALRRPAAATHQGAAHRGAGRRRSPGHPA